VICPHCGAPEYWISRLFGKPWWDGVISPTQRSLAYLRRRGALCAVVERFNAFVTRPDGGKGVRMDLWSFGDILAVEPGRRGALLIQVCHVGDQARRLEKIKSPKVWAKAKVWLAAHNRIEVHGWAIRGAQGTRKRATVTITEVVEG